MSERILLQKKLKDIEIANDINFEIYSCWDIKDFLKYTRTFIKGFNKPRHFFFSYLLNCYDSHYQMYLIKQDDNVIGCFALRDKGSKTVYLYDFTILQEYRGKGYSRKVLNQIYGMCLERNKLKLSLYVKKSNEVAFELYKSEGFSLYTKKKHK